MPKAQKIIAFKKEFSSIRQAAEFHGVSRNILKARMNKGWTIEDAISTSVRPQKRGKIKVEGRTYTSLTEAAIQFGVDPKLAQE